MVAGSCITAGLRGFDMQVGRVQPGVTAAKSRPARGTAGFGALLGPGPELAAPDETAQAAPIALPMSYDVASDAVYADKEARRHGRALLQALAAMQVALLGPDQDGGEAEVQLAQLAASAPQADDPVLRLILREIGVRAAVELARRTA
jgi:hypothetical protein